MSGFVIGVEEPSSVTILMSSAASTARPSPVGLVAGAPKIAISVPSDEIDVGNCTPIYVVRRTGAPFPSAACQYRLGVPPPRVDVQMMRRPSGVHTGLMSTLGSRFSGVNVCRARSHIQMSLV